MRRSGSGGSDGGSGVLLLVVHWRTGNGRRAALALPDLRMVPGGRRWRGIPHEVAQIADATGSNRKTSQAICFRHGSIRSGHVSETRLKHNTHYHVKRNRLFGNS